MFHVPIICFFYGSGKWGLTSLCWENRYLSLDFKSFDQFGICQATEGIKRNTCKKIKKNGEENIRVPEDYFTQNAKLRYTKAKMKGKIKETIHRAQKMS